MIRIGIRELRQNASRYLQRVKAGETIEITERGKLIAVVSPPSKGQTLRERLIAEGKLIPAEKPFWPLPKRVPLTGDGPSLSEVLQELREERLP
jgi:prevent-host-death family protein